MENLDDDARMGIATPKAFRILLRRHQGLLNDFSTRMLGRSVAAGEDVAQEAFLRLWSARDDWESSGKLRSWLLRVAFRLCLDEKRRWQVAAMPESIPATCSDQTCAPAVR